MNDQDAPVTALWEPDITPPLVWLRPAVLYQDRISTFAPVESRGDPDARRTRRLQNELGDLYTPLHMAYIWHQTQDLEAKPESTD